MKKLFTFLLVLTASIGVINAQSGTCGDNLTWELNTETGILTISGTGAMADYTFSTMPWYEYRSSIQSVIITDGVTSIGFSAFNGCSSLTSVTIPNSMTSIGDAAFLGCKSLTYVTIPNSVTSIGSSAFEACSSLTSITIPNSVTSIENYTFSGCSSLTYVTIPNSVTSIGSSAFEACSSLTSVTIPNSVTSIGDGAFQFCSSLTSVTIPNGVTSIGISAFYNVSNIIYHGTATGSPWGAKSVNGYVENNLIYADEAKKILLACFTSTQGEIIIPNSVTSIGGDAFFRCSSLTSVTIPNSVTSIGGDAFGYCTSLTSVTIGESVTSIGSDAFARCTSLTSITIPNSVTSIGGYAFSGCSSLTSITIPNSVTSIKNYTFSGCSSLTSVTIPNSVTSIGSHAFYNCSSLTSVTIGNSVTSIEDHAFSDCSSLSSVTIPNSVTSIGSHAFSGCYSLKSIIVKSGNTVYDSRENCNAIIETATNTLIVGCQNTIIPNSVTSIGSRAFWDCSSLTSITIPNSVTSIEDHAFSGCSSLTSVTIPNSVTSIGEKAFNECSSLTSVTIPNSVTSIGNYAFFRCSSLTSVTIPNSVTSIGSSAFSNCSSLTSITIPNSVTSIENYTFAGCSSLTSITIPNSVTKIGYEAFRGCSSLTSVTIPNSVTSIGNSAFISCSSLTSVTIPNSVTSIGSSAFSGCSSLTSITIPNSVTSIGSSAFSGCSSLSSITIPNSVTSIGMFAFSRCSSLTSVTFESITPPIIKEAFNNTNNCPIYVPCGTKEAYVTALNENNTIDESRVIETVIASGTCGAQGDNLTWELSCDSVLTISGTGEMRNYPTRDSVPWFISELRLSIRTVIIEEGVTNIGNRVFHDCSNIESISIPNSVTKIGSYAFTYCWALDSIVLPDSLISIDGGAFVDCHNLKSIDFPDGLVSIGANCFMYCARLSSVTIPASVSYISSPFRDCKNLTSIFVNPNNSTYDSRNNCNAIIVSATNSLVVGCKTTTIPENVTNIYHFAFANCKTLTSVIIPQSVTTIGKNAFFDCDSLKNITCYAMTPPIVDSTSFDEVNKNIPLYVLASSVDLYKSADGWKEFTNILPIGETPAPCITASGTCGAQGDNLTWELSCDSVLTISGTGEMADYTEVSLVPWAAYRSVIKELNLPEGLTSIGKLAFAQCDSLTSVAIPSTTSFIGYYAFQNCASLISLTLPYGVVRIGWAAFHNCPSLESVTIPNSVSSIETYSFAGCSSLTSINVDDTHRVYRSVDGILFDKNQTTLLQYPAGKIETTYEIPESVTAIGQGSFYGAANLASIDIHEGVTSIGSQAFSYCTGLVSIVLPESVTDLGQGAFFNCSSLTSANIPHGITSVNQLFSKCSNLTSVEIPNSVTDITYYAFSGCSSLTSIVIPNSVTTIGDERSFMDCHSLQSLTIGDGVVSIAKYTFINCTGLTSITCKAVLPPALGANVFYNVDKTIPLYVPCASIEAYKAADGWSEFTNIQAINPDDCGPCLLASGYCGADSTNLTWELSCDSVLTISGTGAMADDYYDYYDSPWYDYRSSIKSVIINDGVTSIGKSAFSNCSSLTSVTIPNSVTSIEQGAFLGCSSLTSVTFEGRTPPSIDIDVFYNTNNCPIYVPCGTKEAYVTALNVNNTIDESRVIEKLPYTYSVLTSDSTLGSVTITQEPTCTEPVIFRADAAEGYQFTQWSDGNTDNPRSLVLTQDTILRALFEQIVIEQDTIIVADSTGISDIIPDGQDTIPHVEVQPGGEITIDRDDIGIGVITIVTIGTESGQVHPWDGGYDNLKNTRVVMEYVLEPLKQQADPNKWYAFAVPFEVDIETGVTRKYGNKSHTPGVDFMILEYDSELRAKTGSGWKEKKSGLLEPGHFYMLGIEGNCNRWLFEKVRDADVVSDKEKDLQHYAHGNSKNDGWHGLGNTTLEYVDMSFDGLNATYVYIYDNQYGKYNIYSIEELILAVGQPFFTQGDNDGSVVFTPNNGKGKGNGKKNMPIYAPSYDVQPSHPRVLLTIETEKINATPDRLYITLHDDNQCGSYRIGRDFMRMDKGSKQVPNFWCPMADGTQLSAHGVTMPTTYTTIPLGIFTPAKGEYTINAHMQDMDDYIVELYYQNVCLGTFMHDMPLTLDLTAGTSYDYSIRISRRVSTDLNPAEDTQCDKDNKWYDVLGRPLPQDAHGIFIRKGEKIIK